jgi:signal transduction histidine kinase
MTVLIIGDDAEFARDMVNRWQAERTVPAFTLVSSTAWQGANTGFDLVVVGPLPWDRLAETLRTLEVCPGAPVLCVVAESAVGRKVREEFPRMLAIRNYEGWLETVVLWGVETLRRIEANSRARDAEQLAASSHRYAILGRYMLEMGHSLNNALTSVLGNTELLLLEPATFSPEVRDQMNTVHIMALRIHEILQRFSSLDMEMQCAQKESQIETQTWARGVGGPS